MVLARDGRVVSPALRDNTLPVPGSTGEGLSFEGAVTDLGCEMAEKPRKWAEAQLTGTAQII